MKITDNELLNMIWLNQLKLLPRGVVQNYVGGGFGLVNKSWHDLSSAEHCCSIEKVTDILGRQQLRKRIIKLADSGKLKFPSGRLLTFLIDNDKSMEAFLFAREFWKSNGMPEGIKNNKCLTVQMKNIKEIAAKCEQELLLNFGC